MSKVDRAKAPGEFSDHGDISIEFLRLAGRFWATSENLVLPASVGLAAAPLARPADGESEFGRMTSFRAVKPKDPKRGQASIVHLSDQRYYLCVDTGTRPYGLSFEADPHPSNATFQVQDTGNLSIPTELRRIPMIILGWSDPSGRQHYVCRIENNVHVLDYADSRYAGANAVVAIRPANSLWRIALS